MRVERASAQARKMLAAARHALRRQPGEKLARVRHNSAAVAASAARRHHFCRLRQRQVEHRRQRRVEAEGLHCPRNQLAVLAREH